MSSLRLHSVVIDVPQPDHQRAVDFWAAAFGQEPTVSESFPEYAQYPDVTPGCNLLVQAVEDDRPRVHLDFYSAERDVDVTRLVGDGATEVMRLHHWVVMRDPAGTTFCVVADHG